MSRPILRPVSTSTDPAPLVDFHLHTTVSDGLWSPAELYAFLRASDIEVFSITDHDAMDAYPVPQDLAQRAIPGVEIDTTHRGNTVHLLAYGIDAQTPLLERLRGQRKARIERMDLMIGRLRRAGKRISMEDVLSQVGGKASLGRPHLARALIEVGEVGSVAEAFERYLGEECEAYVPLERLEAAEAIELAHASVALVSIAHPLRLRSAGALDELRELGADAVEVVHPGADADAQRDLAEYAQSHNMLITGGSDFHGPGSVLRPGIELGAQHIDALRDRIGSVAELIRPHI